MSGDFNLESPNLFPLPEGVKVHTFELGKNPASELIPVPGADTNGNSTAPRERFQIRWDDPQLGVTAIVRENENGRVMVDVCYDDPSLLNKAAVSVGFFGAVEEYYSWCKVIPLTVPDRAGCRGSADFGPLADIVRELGPRIGIVVFLLV